MLITIIVITLMIQVIIAIITMMMMSHIIITKTQSATRRREKNIPSFFFSLHLYLKIWLALCVRAVYHSARSCIPAIILFLQAGNATADGAISRRKRPVAKGNLCIMQIVPYWRDCANVSCMFVYLFWAGEVSFGCLLVLRSSFVFGRRFF